MSARNTSGGNARGASRRGRSRTASAREAVERPQLVDSAAELLASRGGLALCAGPGMGKTTLVMQVAERLEQQGQAVKVLAMGKSNLDDELNKVTRLARSAVVARREGRPVAAIIDNIPPLDERGVRRVRRVLNRLFDADCAVALVLRPEAYQLVEELDPPLPIMRAIRLRVSAAEQADWKLEGFPEGSVDALCRGVPALATALARADPSCVRGDSVMIPSAYDAELSAQIHASMRPALMREERDLRLRMLLLGEGSLAELGAQDDQAGELLLDIAADEPLFGIDIAQGMFSVAGCVHMTSSPACQAALETAAADAQDIVASVLEALILRDDYARAGFVCNLIADEVERARQVLMRSMRYLDAGHVELVRGAVQALDAGADEVADQAACIAQAALAVLSGDEAAYNSARSSAASPANSLQQGQLALLEDLHAACSANKRVKRPRPITGAAQGMSARLRRHAIVRSLMAKGKFREAFEELLSAGLGQGLPTLSEMLLLGDFEFLRKLMGDVPEMPGVQDAPEAGDYFARIGLDEFALYHSAFARAAGALGNGAPDFKGQDQCLLCAERRGDSLVQCAASILASIMDVRRRAYLRAHLRSKKAYELSQASGAPFLSLVALLIDAISCHALGEAPPAIPSNIRTPRGWREVAAIVGACARGNERELLEAVQRLPVAGPPVGAEVIIDLALNHLDDFSHTLSVVLPDAWRKSLRPAHRAAAPDSGLSQEAAERLANMLDVRLFGGFVVTRGGEPIPLSDWERVSARTLLSLLCSSREHRLARADIVQMLWPELDYLRGRNNLYAAVSSLRRTLGQLDGGPQYVLGKEDLLLDTAYVRCDVDQLEDLGLAVLARQGGEVMIIKRCERMRALYKGELDVPLTEDASLLVTRRNELRDLFVDCMVLGSETALEMDDAQKAIWFARAARQADALREDATALLMRGYVGQGRRLDARAAYEEYAEALIDQAAIPPSRAMRKLARELGLTGGGPNDQGPHEHCQPIG